MALSSNRRRMMLFAAPIAVAGAAGLVLYGGDKGGADYEYRTGAVSRGGLTSAISATGTLEAVTTVIIGSQVSGQISEIDVDFNDDVKAGQVVARIDPRDFEADVGQRRAELTVARATVVQDKAAITRADADLQNQIAARAAAVADIARAEAQLENAHKDLDRKQELVKTHSIPTSQLDQAEYAYRAAQSDLKAVKARSRAQDSAVASKRAQVEMAKAEAAQSVAQVTRAEASLNRSEVALSKTYIRAPVDGVVILRNVDVGETVAASTQSPDLFTIARDLREMEVKTSVDEADVGQLRKGLDAVFTVDSFPGREFRGTIRQIRKSPNIQQNVVSYNVMISAQNPDLRLLPGMTANVRIIVQAFDNALRVPNAALRFRPLEGDPAAALLPAAGPDGGNGGGGAVAAQPQAGGGPPGGAGGGARRGNIRQRLEAQLARLTKTLELTKDQQAQIRDIAASGGPRIRELIQSGASRDEIRDAREQMRRENAARISEVLNDEQRAKFNEARAERATQPRTRGTVWVSEAGAVRPVTVLAGATDGTFTQIVNGDLSEGQAIVTGYAKAPLQQADNNRASRRIFGF